jgi:hypothetical protein
MRCSKSVSFSYLNRGVNRCPLMGLPSSSTLNLPGCRFGMTFSGSTTAGGCCPCHSLAAPLASMPAKASSICCAYWYAPGWFLRCCGFGTPNSGSHTNGKPSRTHCRDQVLLHTFRSQKTACRLMPPDVLASPLLMLLSEPRSNKSATCMPTAGTGTQQDHMPSGCMLKAVVLSDHASKGSCSC